MLNVSIVWLMSGQGAAPVTEEAPGNGATEAILSDLRRLRTDQMQLVEKMARLEKRLRAVVGYAYARPGPFRMTESREARLKRLRMRSWRRGTREMDLILGPFADSALPDFDPASLDAYEILLSENDQDLYLWIGNQVGTPREHSGIIGRIRAFHSVS
jgi:antitoxin CptB